MNLQMETQACKEAAREVVPAPPSWGHASVGAHVQDASATAKAKDHLWKVFSNPAADHEMFPGGLQQSQAGHEVGVLSAASNRGSSRWQGDRSTSSSPSSKKDCTGTHSTSARKPGREQSYQNLAAKRSPARPNLLGVKLPTEVIMAGETEADNLTPSQPPLEHLPLPLQAVPPGWNWLRSSCCRQNAASRT